MLAGDVDAAAVAFKVGYESASQSNREHSRLFGQPLIRDIRDAAFARRPATRISHDA
jgi:hypothetical protein